MIFAEEYVPSGGGFEEQIEASFAVEKKIVHHLQLCTANRCALYA